MLQDATFNVKQVGLSPAGYAAPGAPSGSYSGSAPGYAPPSSAPMTYIPGMMPGGGMPGGAQTAPFPGQPQGLMPSGGFYPGAGGPSSVPGMPQMMPGGYPGNTGAMAGYTNAYGGGMAPSSIVPASAYAPAMMGSGPAPVFMSGSGQAGMYQPTVPY